MINKKSIETNFRCNICDKFYASKSSLCHHNKKFHIIPDNTSIILDNTLDNTSIILDNTSIKYNQNKKYNCSNCNKLFNNYQNRWKHEKLCNNKINNDFLIEENKSLKEEITEIKKLLLQNAKIHPKTLQKINKQLINNTNTINNITNNTINNTTNNTLNNNINITYVKFGNEKLSQLLTKKEMTKIINKVRSSVEESIKMVHFNNKRPEYKNILITNMKDNLAYIFNGKKFEVVSKDSALNNLFNDHMCNIECFLDDNNIEETFKNRQLFNFRREINGESKNYDISNYKAYKINEIKQLIYNNSSSKLLKKLNSLKLEEKIIEENISESSNN